MGRVTRAPGRRVRQALAVPVLVLVVAAAWGPATPDAAGPSEGARVLQIQLDVPEGTPVAELAAVVEEVATDPRGWGAHGVVVEVVDQGIGIPQDELEMVFERFHRASNAPERSGSGLGLSVVKLLVEGMGGTISVHSRLGEGSCFTVNLPR